MELKIKPIVNSLFYATVTHEGFEGTAVGYTKDEAAKKALGWLQREIEIAKAELDSMSSNRDSILRAIENRLDEQVLYTNECLQDDIWQELETDSRELAKKIIKMTLEAKYKYSMKTSVDILEEENLSNISLKSQILLKVQDIVSKQFDLQLSTITLDSDILNDFHADGLDILELIEKLEEEFDVEISEDLLNVSWHSKAIPEPVIACTIRDLLDHIYQQICII
ncbi:MAG TPA: phosphopantetheine-binding protein [Allocoleopsis sp.]